MNAFKTSTAKIFKILPFLPLTKKSLLPCTLIAFLCLYFYLLSLAPSPESDHFTHSSTHVTYQHSLSASPPLSLTVVSPATLLPSISESPPHTIAPSTETELPQYSTHISLPPSLSSSPSRAPELLIPTYTTYQSSVSAPPPLSHSSASASPPQSPATELELPQYSSHISLPPSSILSFSPSPAPELPLPSYTTYHSSVSSPSPLSHSSVSAPPSLSLSPSPVPDLPNSRYSTYHSSLYSSPYLSPTPSAAPEPSHSTQITYQPSLAALTPTLAPEFPQSRNNTYQSFLSSSPLPFPPALSSYTGKEKAYKRPCDYFNGRWVRDRRRSPLYNSTCSVIREPQNCMANGRPDKGYLYWRWKPRRCNLPRFDPETFLQVIRNRHVAFVGDSVVRNQLESLICMLSSASTPKLIYRGLGWWYFPSHNATLSSYWAPFLVQGVQRKLTGPGPHHNTMYLDQVNESWDRDMDEMDLIVLGFGHWFADIPSVYYEGGSVLGCQNFPDLNCTDIGFYVPIRKALRTALNSIIERKAARGNGVGVIVRTYTPVHFKGAWDKGGTCSKTKPYKHGEKKLEPRDAEIRMIGMEELQNAKEKAKQFGGFRFEVLDLTKLSSMRPDGHPGAYRSPFPFAKGVPKNVQNDCTHWCLPGPIDTWNEIFLEMMKNWKEPSRTDE